MSMWRATGVDVVRGMSAATVVVKSSRIAGRIRPP